MTTIAIQPVFAHNVPDTEPPVGTIAVFKTALANGVAKSTNMLIRTPSGWSRSSDVRHGAYSWKTLTDVDAKNAAIKELEKRRGRPFQALANSPVVAVQVQIIRVPRPDAVERLIAIHNDMRRLDERKDQSAFFVEREELRDRLEGVIELLAPEHA